MYVSDDVVAILPSGMVFCDQHVAGDMCCVLSGMAVYYLYMFNDMVCVVVSGMAVHHSPIALRLHPQRRRERRGVPASLRVTASPCRNTLPKSV